MHSDPVTPERRSFEDALDAALDETGAISGNTSRALEAFEIQGQSYSSTAEVPPDVRAAIDETSQALDDIFGGPPMKTHMIAKSGAAAEKLTAAASEAAVAAAPPPATAALGSPDDTAPMPAGIAEGLVAEAQRHSHAETSAPALVAPDPEVAPPTAPAPAPASWTGAADAVRPPPSRVTMASDPVPVERPTWMRHGMAILAIAVIGGFTLTGIAILLMK